MLQGLKIHIVDVPEFLQPPKSPFRYPAYAADWGVEQDFEKFLLDSDLIEKNSSEATHHYLPIYWTRYWLQNDYGRQGHQELHQWLKTITLDESKLFTVCQYDDGPMIDLDFKKGLFLSSRKSVDVGIDIPLLASEIHAKGYQNRKYDFGFMGRLETHDIRTQLFQLFHSNSRFYFNTKSQGIRAYSRNIQKSKFSLCPRGYGGSSFRIYESMQLGVAPIILGDIDVRPFKKQIDWDSFSYYFSSLDEFVDSLPSLDLDNWSEMGRKAKNAYFTQLRFQKWCQLLINSLT